MPNLSLYLLVSKIIKKVDNFSVTLRQWVIVCLIIAPLLFGLNLYSVGKPETISSQNQSISHTPIEEFSPGVKLNIEVLVEAPVEWVRFFYRVEGVEHFQVRNMKKSSEKLYHYILDTSLLITQKFDYYLMAKVNGKVLGFPALAPEKYIEAKGEITEPKKDRLKLPMDLRISGSIGGRISGSAENELEKNFSADGNVTISRLFRKDDFEVDLSLNSANTNHPLEGNQNFDLSHLNLAVKTKSHFGKIGDISLISDSQFSVFGLGRRGIEYRFDNKKLYFHIFDISSQQQLGWEGLIPKKNLSIIGGIIGLGFFNQKFTLKLIYVTGKDDPTDGRNIGVSFLDPRKGDVWALVPELNLFDKKLKITGEFAQSNHDENLLDEEGSKKDQAWRIGGRFSIGIFTLAANYKVIGKNFNPISQQYFTNDRKGYDLTMGLSFRKLQFSLNYQDEENNLDNSPDTWSSFNTNGGAHLNWDLFKWLSLNLGFRKNKIETLNPEIQDVLFQGYNSDDYSLGLSFRIGSANLINLYSSYSQLKSDISSEYDRDTLTLNLGGSLRFGQTLHISPNLSYGVSQNDGSGIQTKTYNVFLSADLNIIPRTLSITTSSSFFLMRTETGNIDNINVSLHLNLYMGWIKKQLSNVVLSVRGNLKQIKSEAYSDTNKSIWLHLSFAF